MADLPLQQASCDRKASADVARIGTGAWAVLGVRPLGTPSESTRGLGELHREHGGRRQRGDPDPQL